jgi:hypothetical protein
VGTKYAGGSGPVGRGRCHRRQVAQRCIPVDMALFEVTTVSVAAQVEQSTQPIGRVATLPWFGAGLGREDDADGDVRPD